MESNYVIVLVTCANRAEAQKIGQALLDERLIACVNIIEPVTSFFNWRGKVDCSNECLAVMKSRMDLFAELTRRVKALHSYEVPEVLALPILAGSESYLSWMNEVLKPKTKS